VALPVGKSGMERGLRFGSHDDQAGLALDKLLKGSVCGFARLLNIFMKAS
jgi:hypothetical protein